MREPGGDPARPTAGDDAGLDAFSTITERLARYPDRQLWYFQGRDVVRRDYRDVYADVLAACAALADAGVREGSHVGILAENSYPWVVADLALTRMRAVSVALPVEVNRDTPLDHLRTAYHLSLLLLSRAEYDRRAPDQPWAADLDALPDLGGAKAETPAHGVPVADPATAFTMTFSSGSSGLPKCIRMSAPGTVAAMEEYIRQLRMGPDDAIFVVLPLTAFPQRLMVYLAIWGGFDIRLADIPRLHQALAAMRPTIVVGPPAFFEAVENRFRALPEPARRRAEEVRRDTASIPDPEERRLARARAHPELHALLGGNARLLLTGSAPARVETLDLLEGLGFPIHEFYGMTEVSVISWNLPGATRHGSVGLPLLPGTIRLADDGEILVRFEPPRSVGYYGAAADGDATYRPDGWVGTGDIGRFDGDYLHVVGRKKAVIITRSGYKLQPEPVERALAGHPDVAHAVLLGGEHARVVTAVVSLRREPDDALRTDIERLVAELNRDLPGPAEIARVVCTGEPFTAANGLLTRTMKADRAAIAEHFEDRLLAGPASER